MIKRKELPSQEAELQKQELDPIRRPLGLNKCMAQLDEMILRA